MSRSPSPRARRTRTLTRRDSRRPARPQPPFPLVATGQWRRVSSSERPLRVLTWHVHGSYLNYLTQVPVTWLLPVRPGPRRRLRRPRGDLHLGRRRRTRCPPTRSRELDVDLVLTQSRRTWEVDRHELLGARVRDLPRVHVEHDPPPHWPNDAEHPVQDPDALLVHVTPFNALMWDSGRDALDAWSTTACKVPDDAPHWTGETARAVTVVNNLWNRGRRLGPDVFERVARDRAGRPGRHGRRAPPDLARRRAAGRAAPAAAGLPGLLQPDPLHLAGARGVRGDGARPAGRRARDDRDGHGGAERRQRLRRDRSRAAGRRTCSGCSPTRTRPPSCPPARARWRGSASGSSASCATGARCCTPPPAGAERSSAAGWCCSAARPRPRSGHACQSGRTSATSVADARPSRTRRPCARRAPGTTRPALPAVSGRAPPQPRPCVPPAARGRAGRRRR